MGFEMQIKDQVAFRRCERRYRLPSSASLPGPEHPTPLGVSSISALVVVQPSSITSPATERHQAARPFLTDRRSQSSDQRQLRRSFRAIAPATTLDQVQLAIIFVGPVDGHVQPLRLLQGDNFDPDIACQFGGAHRGRHAGDFSGPHRAPFRQRFDQPGGGRPGAKPDFHATVNQTRRPAWRRHI